MPCANIQPFPTLQVFIGHCHGHIRNFVIKGMAGAVTEKLKLLLEDDLAEFSSFERMSVDAMDLIRAAYKELHPGGAYAKGKGREFLAWSKEHFPKEMWMPSHLGSSQVKLAQRPPRKERVPGSTRFA